MCNFLKDKLEVGEEIIYNRVVGAGHAPNVTDLSSDAPFVAGIR